MTQEVIITCKLCGSQRGEALFVARDLRFGLPGNFNIVRCSSCGLTFVNPQPDVAELKKHYPTEYYTHSRPRKTLKNRLEDLLIESLFWVFQTRKSSRATPAMRRASSRLALKLNSLAHKVEVSGIDYLAATKGNLLEIGFGNGAFLDFARKKGYSTFGVEPDPVNCENIRSRGHQVYCGELKGAQYASDKFDFIRMRHVLEHVLDPVELAGEIHRVQKPGGYFFVEVPNFGGLYSAVFQKNWSQLEAPRHLFHFTPETLKRVLTQAGYSIVRVTLDTQPWHLLSSLKYAIDESNELDLSRNKRRPDIRTNVKVSSSLHTLSRWLTKHGFGDNLIIIAMKPL